MAEKQALIIDREVWLRGDKDASLLLDGEGRRCCVGIYLKSCGVPDDLMMDVADVRALVADEGLSVLPGRARWLYHLGNGDVPANIGLYKDNDSEGIEDPDRERAIALKFARYGVEVSFVN